MFRCPTVRIFWVFFALLLLAAGCRKDPPEESGGKEEPTPDVVKEGEDPDGSTGEEPKPGPVVAWCVTGSESALNTVAEEWAWGRWTSEEGVECLGLFEERKTAEQSLRWLKEEKDGLTVEGLTTVPAEKAVFIGPVWELFGSGNEGRSTVLRSEDRDALLAHFESWHEGEPVPSVLWVLDARSGGVWQGMAWDAAFAPDDSGVLLGQDRLVEDMAQPDEPEDNSDTIKSELGISDTQLDLYSFEDAFVGSTHIVQPVLLRYPPGAQGEFTREPLSMAGGGTLGRRGEELLGLHRPRYWEYANDRTPEVWFKLDLEGRRWVDFEEPGGPSPMVSELTLSPTEPPAQGTVLVTTRDGTLGLKLLSGSGWIVQAVRLSPEGR